MSSVILVDDHELIRQGLRRAFDRDGHFEVAGEASSVEEALCQIRMHAPTVVVTDLQLPDRTGIDLIRELREESDTLGLVLLTMHAGDDTLFAALEAGASSLVSKEAPADDVVSAAKQAAVSPRSFSARDLVGAMTRRRAPQPESKLSDREQEILTLLSEGLGVSAIARRLYISDSTAKTHISRIYDKLGAANRAQAIMLAIRAGFLRADDAAGTRV